MGIAPLRLSVQDALTDMQRDLLESTRHLDLRSNVGLYASTQVSTNETRRLPNYRFLAIF